MRHSTWLWLWLVGCGPGSDAAPDRPPNLLMISIDTLRRDHVGALGGGDRTPFLDRLASEGLLATDFQQCSNWTWNATTCTVTGRTALELGHLPRLDAQGTPIPSGTEMLPGWLADAGYATHLVTSNDYFSARWGNTQGFQQETLVPFDTAETIGALGLEQLPRQGPWYLHLHVVEPHQPYAPPPAFSAAVDALEPWPEDLRVNSTLNKWRALHETLEPADQDLLEAHFRALYDGEVRWLDQQLEQVWTALEADGRLDDTVVAVWSDHGEQFWEHGFQGHAMQLLGEETDALFLLWGPGVRPQRWDGPTAAVDVVPTVLKALDQPVPDAVVGVPVGEADPHRPRYADTLARLGAVQSVTVDGWRLHYSWSGVLRLHDRNTDPLEQVDLYTPDHPKVAELWALLEPRVQAMAALTGGDPEPASP